MATRTTARPHIPTTTGRIACKVWLSATEARMLQDLAARGHMSKSATVRGSILTTWERTFQSGPGRRNAS